MKCVTCLTVFDVGPVRKNKAKYCSRACHADWMRANLSRQSADTKRCNLTEYARLLRIAFPDEMREKAAAWVRTHREQARSYTRRWQHKNQHSPKWIESRKATINRRKESGKLRKYDREYCKKRRDTDLNFKLRKTLQSRIRMALKKGSKASSTTQLLGCSIESFKLYLESKFESGMSWENYSFSGWHIDHIMPCAIFDLSKPEHQKRCFHFSNMQPMWAADNLRKGDRVTTNQFNLL